MMEKLDLSRQYKNYYTAGNSPKMITLDKVNYLSIRGKGDPSSEAFSQHIQALYAVAYAIKFQCKAMSNDFVVAKLEGLWWYDTTQYAGATISTAPQLIPRSEWEYRLLIRLPLFVSVNMVEQCIASTITAKQIPLTKEVHYYEMTEGLCVQILHTGPFNTEPQTLTKLATFMQQENLLQNGLHHEIYLSDFRKTAPEKLKTILREPVLLG